MAILSANTMSLEDTTEGQSSHSIFKALPHSRPQRPSEHRAKAAATRKRASRPGKGGSGSARAQAKTAKAPKAAAAARARSGPKGAMELVDEAGRTARGIVKFGVSLTTKFASGLAGRLQK